MDEYLGLFNDEHLYLRIIAEESNLFQDIIKRERNRNTQPTAINMYYTAKAMNDSTFFLRIPSFGDNMSNKLVEDNRNAIVSRPYPIVNLRCNGGGNNENFSKLMSLVYSRPYWNYGVELYSTPNIAALYREFAADVLKGLNGSRHWQTAWKAI